MTHSGKCSDFSDFQH